MPEFAFKQEVSFQVWCKHCGEGLCFKSEGLSEGEERTIKDTNTYGLGVLVGFCPKCRDKLLQQGIEIGLGLKKKVEDIDLYLEGTEKKKKVKRTSCPQ